MPIKFNCHQCGAKLRVPEQHVGKMARCPQCDEKCLVPEYSQRAPESVAASNFDDAGSEINQPPVAMPVDIPPANVAPEMSPPQIASFASTVDGNSFASVPPMVASPYASPVPSGKPNSAAYASGTFQPLYDARSMMKFFGWCSIVLGVINCLTIYGIIGGAIMIWLGWLIKGASESITIGVEMNDLSQIRLANERIAMYFRIMCVLMIIGLVFFALFLFLMIVIIGFAGFSAM